MKYPFLKHNRAVSRTVAESYIAEHCIKQYKNLYFLHSFLSNLTIIIEIPEIPILPNILQTA